MTARLVVAGALAVGLLSLWARGLGYQDLPLPGTRVDGDSYRIAVAFDDVVNLARGAQVKVDGLPVGRVQEIRVDGFQAVADLAIKDEITLRVGTTARLRYDTPLGELFVEVKPARVGDALRDGDEISAGDTTTAPSVEDTLAQASLLINGGGLAQLQTINEELNAAIGGREDVARGVLERSLRLLRGANAGRADLDRLLRDLKGASSVLAGRRQVFGEALAELGPLADVLREDTPAFDRLLRHTASVTARANRTMAQTQEQTVQILEQLGPILEQVLAAEPAFVHGLAALAKADRVLSQMIPGDFIGLDAVIHLDLSRLLDAPDGDPPPPDDGGPLPGIPGLPGLPDLPGLLEGATGGELLGEVLSGLNLGRSGHGR